MSRMSELDMDRQIIASLGPDDVGQLTYALKANADAIGKLWQERGCEFGTREIEEVQLAIVALGQIVRDTANRRAAA